MVQEKSLIEMVEKKCSPLIHGNYDNSEKVACACQMLIIFSTSDYLLNIVLSLTIKSLQISIDYVCEKLRTSRGGINYQQIQNGQAQIDPRQAEIGEELECTAQNCSRLANCIEFIVQIRNLDNFKGINREVKVNVLQILNSIFIHLTEIYPMLAIQMSKIMQLLKLNEK